jgi:hypothetical protein
MPRNDGTTPRSRSNNKLAHRRWKRRKRRANEAKQRRRVKTKAKVEQSEVAKLGEGD